MTKRRVVVAGGTGFVGRALQDLLLSRGFDVVVLTRSSKGVQWDAKSLGPWVSQLEGAFAVVNLVGENVAQPWTDENRKKILNSRVDSTKVIGQAILELENPPEVWLNGSAVGFYGERGDEELTESSSAGPAAQFLVSTCLEWEGAMAPYAREGVRHCVLRTGFVLGKDGGGLPLLTQFTKNFLGGAVGSGKQWMPWIHIDDLCHMILHILESKSEGVWNGVGPNPARNGDFMATLRKVHGRPWSPPAPSFALSLFKAVGGPEPTVALVSTRVLPARALSERFEFQFPELEAALKNLL